jgi:hypothetical protein
MEEHALMGHYDDCREHDEEMTRLHGRDWERKLHRENQDRLQTLLGSAQVTDEQALWLGRRPGYRVASYAAGSQTAADCYEWGVLSATGSYREVFRDGTMVRPPETWREGDRGAMLSRGARVCFCRALVDGVTTYDALARGMTSAEISAATDLREQFRRRRVLIGGVSIELVVDREPETTLRVSPAPT